MKRSIIVLLFCFFVLMSISGAAYAAADASLQLKAAQIVKKLTFQTISEDQILVSALDAEDNPVEGLKPEDFVLQKGVKTAKIVSVEPLRTSKDIPLNIVLVVDNSFSMKQRNAVKPMLSALEAFFKTIRPIDNVHAIVFDDKNTVDVQGHDLHVKTFQNSDPQALRDFFKENLAEMYTDGTFLYDGMLSGLDIIKSMPEKSNKFLVVFSDGRDINSIAKTSEVEAAAQGIVNFSAYTVDYTPAATLEPFLKSFAETAGGKAWKATSAEQLLPIFESFSTTLLHRYVVTYRFLNPPEGSLSISPQKITIEEVTTIDSSPLLNHVYFETGMGEISPKYNIFQRQSETENFSDESLKNAMEKHYQILNIIGSRMKKYPEARIKLVGCNSNTGEEKGRMDLSKQRVSSVKSYLKYIWGIDPVRIEEEARNLPERPSTNRVEEGRIENQRVEIHSDSMEILDTLKTTYIEKSCDTEQIKIAPQLKSEVGLASWKIILKGDDEILKTFEGEGDMPAEFVLQTSEIEIDRLAQFKAISADIDVVDKEGNALTRKETTTIPVDFIKREERMAQKKGYKVVENYALILFDYDSAEIKAQNENIVKRITNRLTQIPDPMIRITGHTDVIGSEDYNIKLSEKRAMAVTQQLNMINTGGSVGSNITAAGVGPFEPIYSNIEPEGRALNRTVTISLEYENTQQ